MDNDKAAAAIAALDDLARSELAATGAGRHGRAIRVLGLAEQLARLQARRVADVADQELDIAGEDDGGAFTAMTNVGVRRAHRFVTPGEDLVRVLADVLPQALAAQHAVPPARELDDLLRLRAQLTDADGPLRARVAARIAQLGDLLAPPAPARPRLAAVAPDVLIAAPGEDFVADEEELGQ